MDELGQINVDIFNPEMYKISHRFIAQRMHDNVLVKNSLYILLIGIMYYDTVIYQLYEIYTNVRTKVKKEILLIDRINSVESNKCDNIISIKETNCFLKFNMLPYRLHFLSSVFSIRIKFSESIIQKIPWKYN